jgi:hypothetical protein
MLTTLLMFAGTIFGVLIRLTAVLGAVVVFCMAMTCRVETLGIVHIVCDESR